MKNFMSPPWGESMVSFEFSTILKHIPQNLHIIIGLL